MVALNREFVWEDLREIFIDLYGRCPENFDLETRILADLHADLPMRDFIGVWFERAAKKLEIEARNLKFENRDYTIGEILEVFLKSKRERYDGKTFYSVSRDVDLDKLGNLETN